MSDEQRSPVDELVRRHAPASFAPGFAARVMDRVAAEDEVRFETLVVRRFRWLAAAAGLAAIALLSWNALGDRPWDDQSFLEAALGLQPVSVQAAYTSGLLEEVGP